MGRAPQEKVYKKLISSYLKLKISNKQNELEKQAVSKITSSIYKFGFNSPETCKLRDELLQEHFESRITNKDLKKDIKSYPSLVENNLYNTKHKAEKKGRYHVRSDFYYEIKKSKPKVDF